METKRELLISKGWIQAVALVGLCGFLLLGILAYRTYTDEPPIPSKVIGGIGQVLFTAEDVSAGQEVFPKKRSHGVRLNLRPWRSVGAVGRAKPLSRCAKASVVGEGTGYAQPTSFPGSQAMTCRHRADHQSREPLAGCLAVCGESPCF